jgi:hypothetical protein
MPRRFVQRQRAAGMHSIRHPVGPRADVDVLENSPTGNQTLFLGAVAKLRKATISFMSFRTSAGSHATPTGQIFVKIYIRLFFESLSRKFKLHLKTTRITGTLHEDQYAFLSYLAQFFLERKIFEVKVVEKIKTHILCSIIFFPAVVPFMR